MEDNPSGMLGEYDLLEDGEYPPCPFCESTQVVSTLDWHEGSVIPYDPIRREDVERTDHRGNRYYILINVYDVSKRIKPNTDNHFSDPVTVDEIRKALSGLYSHLPLVLEVNGMQQKCMNFHLEKERIVLTDQPVVKD